jgi:hypothetical protein
METKTRYISTKLFENYSVAIRQWKAQHSHCQLLHGYALKFKVWFASNEPDIENQLDDRSEEHTSELQSLAVVQLSRMPSSA